MSLDRVLFGRQVYEDEIDLESGFLMMPGAVPEPAPVTGPEPYSGPAPVAPEDAQPVVRAPEGTAFVPAPGPGLSRQVVELTFQATRDQIYKAFPAVANLADKSDDGKITIRVTGTSTAGYDPSWLRNAVEEPLDEADIERQ